MKRGQLLRRLAAVQPVGDLLLDEFPGAAAAYSLRKLRSAYTGAAIRVRRDSDNAEQDIGFDTNGGLDLNSLESFVGAVDDGFVTTWYDQSENANDAEQENTDRQGIIVEQGEVNTVNTKPCVSFVSRTHYLFDEITPTSVISLAQVVSELSVNYILWNGIGGGAARGLFYAGSLSGINGTGIFDGNIKSINSNKLDYRIASYIYDGTSYNVADNDDSLQQLASGNQLDIKSLGRDNFSLNGNYSEVILYNTNEENNRQDIISNINNYYDVF